MTKEDGFRAMEIFLTKYADIFGDRNGLPLILTAITTEMTNDGLPADPATWDDWCEICDAVEAARA